MLRTRADRGPPATCSSVTGHGRIFAVNVKALYRSAKHTVPLMRQAGGGCIIHTPSTAAINPRPGLVWYNGSNGAVNTITQGTGLSMEAGRNLTVRI